MKPAKTASARSLFAATKAALAATALSWDLASSSLIATAMIAKIPFEKSSGVIPDDLKISTALGHLAVMMPPQVSGVIDGSLPIAASSAFAASFVLTLLMNLSILSRSSVVRGMAPAALIWSGGVSARRSGAAAKPSTATVKALAIASRERKLMELLPDDAAFIH